jgi:class 3 adenylate cyclase
MNESERGRLEALEDQSRRLSVLHEMVHEISLATTEDDLFRLTAHYTPRIVNADRASVCLLQPDGVNYDIFALAGVTGKMPVSMKLRLDETGVGKAIRERRLVGTGAMDAADALADWRMLAQVGMRSVMNAPLITGGDCIGTVNVATTRPEAYGAEDEHLLGQIASLLGSNLRNRRLVAEVREALAVAEHERGKSERLLLNILPSRIAERLKSGEAMIADRVAEACVLFADIVGFTTFSSGITPGELVTLLNRIFSAFDAHVVELGLEKIKTIGDAYMVVGGLKTPLSSRPSAVAEMALRMRDDVTRLSVETGRALELRVGVHCGEVVAGVIGTKTVAYDLWGDTVNTASRMESHGVPGEIQCTSAAASLFGDAFELRSRGVIDVKGKGPMETWFLIGKRAASPL